MPGPPLSKTFTYDGTPNTTGDKTNQLNRVMVQTQRFFISKDTGTHSKIPLRANIPQNSSGGIGLSSTQINSKIDE